MTTLVLLHRGPQVETTAVGQKAASLARLAALGLPVPPAVALTDAQRVALAGGPASQPLLQGILAALGQGPQPTLLSVRSSPSHSIPGALDTVLNLGAGEQTHAALVSTLGEAGAWLTRFNFVASWGRAVVGLRGEGRLERDPFAALLDDAMLQHGADQPSGLDAPAAKALHDRATALLGKALPPQSLEDQLSVALGAVATHWGSPRALAWRHQAALPQDATCGVVVQRMVLGHRNANSGCGVALSRHPTRGTPGPAGDFVRQGQGDALMTGLCTPTPLTGTSSMGATMHSVLPEALRQLETALHTLEEHWHRPVEVEFTVEDGTLWLLQVRPASLGAQASLKAAQDLVAAHRATPAQALLTLDGATLSRALGVEVTRDAPRQVLARGVPACVGAASGTVVLHAADAVALAASGGAPVLVRPETRVEDVPGLRAAVAIVAARGGTTSHAAVVARSHGIPCLVGCQALNAVPGQDAMLAQDGTRLTPGRAVTLDATAGELLDGALPLTLAKPPEGLRTVLGWALGALHLPVVGLVHQPAHAALLDGLGVTALEPGIPQLAPGAPVPPGASTVCLRLSAGADAAAVTAAIQAVRPHVARLVVALGVPTPALVRAIRQAGGDALACGWQDVLGTLVASAQAGLAGDV